MSESSPFWVCVALLFLVATGAEPAVAQDDAESSGERRARLLKVYDADGDGQLSGPEREALRAARREERNRSGGPLAGADTDGDGKVSDEERKVFRESRAAEDKARRADRLKAFDTDGDGQLSKEERDAMRAKRGGRGEHHKRMLERFDADGDGSLSESERAAARGEMRRKRGNPGGPRDRGPQGDSDAE